MPDKILLIRQGDVILRSIAEIPKDAEQVEKRVEIGNAVVEPDRVVIKGETGNNHVLNGVRAYIDRMRGEVYVDVAIPTRLVHKEHPTVDIPTGKYVIYTIQDFVRGRGSRPLD